MRICISSHYSIHPATYNGLLFEACRALAAMADTHVIAPENIRHGSLWKGASRVKRNLTGLPLPTARRERVSERFDLFLFVCMCAEDLLHLTAIDGWREQSDKAAVFLFETWSAQARTDAGYYRLLDQFDHVFLFNPNSLAAVQHATSAKCSYLPAASDCLLATPYPRPGPRPIDVYGMGRIDQTVHAQLLEMSRDHKLFYLWDPWGMNMPRDGYPAARHRTYHLIRSSRLFTSFNFSIQSSKSQVSRGEEAIPARVFEGAAAGAVLFGTAPRMPEFDALFDWPDAFWEIPMDPVDMHAAYEEVHRRPERLRRASILNASQSLRRHDWAYRLEAMLTTLDLPLPSQLRERKARLAALADMAEADLGISVVATG